MIIGFRKFNGIGAWLHVCARIFALEMMHFRYWMSKRKYQDSIEAAIAKNDLFEREFVRRLEEEDVRIRAKRRQWPHEFHSDNSIEVVKLAFREIACLDIEKFVADDCGRMHNLVRGQRNIPERNLKEYMAETKQTVTKIRPYDGYQGRPLWEKDDWSTCYDYATDQQCRVPLPSVDELREELGIAPLPH